MFHQVMKVIFFNSELLMSYVRAQNKQFSFQIFLNYTLFDVNETWHSWMFFRSYIFYVFTQILQNIVFYF